MTVRVVLGARDRDLAAYIRAQLQEISDIALVAMEETSADVLAAVGGVQGLDVVLLQQGLGPLAAMELIRELAIRHPYVAVVLIAEEANAETFAAAMAAGARGVISSEPTISELQSRIESAAEWARTMRRHFGGARPAAPPSRLGGLLAVCGAKGGTGTTTLAVQLAVALAAERSVCLVDLDLQKGDVPSFMDVHHRRSINDLVGAADDLDGTAFAEAVFVHEAGPHLLLAPADGERAEDLTARSVRQILSAVRARYELVIVDCGSHMVEGNAMAVELADQVLLTCTPDLPALRGAKRLARMWARLDIRKEEDVSVVLVKHDRRNEIQPDLVRRMLGSPLLGSTVPPAFRALEEAANTGAPRAVKGGDYTKAIGRLIGELGLPTAPAAPAASAGAAGQAGDRGAVLPEFAAVFPLIGLVMLVIWQVVMVGLTSMYSSHAANEAARQIAVLGYDTPQARREVRRRTAARVGGSWGDEKHLRIGIDRGYAKVTIDTPAVLPGWRTPLGISTRSKIVNEGSGEPR